MSRTNFKPGTLLNPLPVVMAAVDDGEGGANIITIAWTGIVNSNPPMTYISVKPERYSYELLKKRLCGREMSREEIGKAANYLYRRGFSWDEIKSAVNRLESETED